MQSQKIIDEFIEDQKLEGKAEGTVFEYRQRLEDIAKFCKAQNLQINQLQKTDIQNYIRTLFKKSLKVTTIRAKLSCFCIFNKWEVDSGYTSELVISASDYPKLTKSTRIRRLTDEELDVFKVHISECQENIRAAFWLMIGTGARVGEVAHLKPSDVKLQGKAVYVDIKDAKWGSDRCIPIIDPEAAMIVWKYREELEIDNRPLFRVSKRTLQGYATAFANKTGIKFHCHLLRHTFAALLTERGVPMTTTQYLLGHKTLGMTAHYAQSALVDMSKVIPEIDL